MNLLETIMSAQSGKAVQQMADANGVDVDDALKALGGLIPGVAGNLRKNAEQSEGLESLFNALQKGNHNQYLDKPEIAVSNEGIADGNNILGHILGSKDASRSLAGEASNLTGLDSTLLKKMLPVVASLVMGALSKQSQSGGSLSDFSRMLGGNAPARNTAEPRGMLESFLDMDNDGSVVDDVMGMAAKFLLK